MAAPECMLASSLVAAPVEEDRDTEQSSLELLRAATSGRFKSVRSLVRRRAVPIDAQLPRVFGQATPLVLAALNGHTETALFLLKEGANVNASMGTESVLGWSVQVRGNEHLCTALVLAGADPCVTNVWGQGPLQLAKAPNREAVFAGVAQLHDEVLRVLADSLLSDLAEIVLAYHCPLEKAAVAREEEEYEECEDATVAVES